MPHKPDLIDIAFKRKGSPSAYDMININYFNQEEVLTHICGLAEKKQGFAMATLNLDHVVKLRDHSRFLQAYTEQDIVVADGFPIVWIARLQGITITRTTGSDLVLPLMREMDKSGLSVAIVGTTPEVLDETCKRLVQMMPRLKIAYTRSPPFGFDPDSEESKSLMREVAASGAAICFLALGAPKQEILAAVGRRVAPEVGFVSVGAAIDFIAGKQKRAPAWVRNANLEWLWRLAHNPVRLAYRYLQCMVLLPPLFMRASKKYFFQKLS